MQKRIEFFTDKENVQVLDSQAKEQGISRNALLNLITENYVTTVQQLEAESQLKIPLESLSSQLNVLTNALNHNTKYVTQDLKSVQVTLEKLTERLSDF